MDKIAACWERVGIALNMEPSALTRYRRDHQDSKECVFKMVSDWLSGTHQGQGSSQLVTWADRVQGFSLSVTWADLVQALRESNEHETARELKDTLVNRTSSTTESSDT